MAANDFRSDSTMPDNQSHIVIVAGPNGSGKSTSAAAIIRDHFGVYEYVNADVIAQGLSGFNVDAVAVQAGRLMLNRIDVLAATRANFAVETTLSSRSLVPRIRNLKHSGYQVHLIFFWLPSPEFAVSRVALRVQQGGHNVPSETVHRRYHRGLSNLIDLYLPLMDSWRIYDSSVGPPPREVAISDERGIRILESQTWTRIQREAS